MTGLIGHNNPPPDEVVVRHDNPVEPFDLRYRPMLAQMDVDGIVDVIRRLEAELVPMRDKAIAYGGAYNRRYDEMLVQSRKSGFMPPFQPHDWDETRFRELQSVLSDCRIEIRERRNRRHPEAWPSEHERNYARQRTFGT